MALKRWFRDNVDSGLVAVSGSFDINSRFILLKNEYLNLRRLIFAEIFVRNYRLATWLKHASLYYHQFTNNEQGETSKSSKSYDTDIVSHIHPIQ